MNARVRHETIVILDFGSQYTQVIARRVRELHVYSVILRPDTSAAKIRELAPRGVILSGGPASVYAPKAPRCDPKLWETGLPILGLCYGMQLMGHMLGGEVARGLEREYGRAELEVAETDCPLFQGLAPRQIVWMSHGDKLTRLPAGFTVVAASANSPLAAIEHRTRKIFGLQFHPEVVHTPQGREILRNFVLGVCGCRGDWTMESFIESSLAEIRARVGSDRVVLGLSGGVDSSVAAVLIHKAIGEQLTCIFVNNGLLRKDEPERVQATFRDHFHMRLVCVDAGRRFLAGLRGVADPERKRKIIGREFIRVFEDSVKKLVATNPGRGGTAEDARAKAAPLPPRHRFLAQGTTYPDVIESVPIAGPSATIKSHHNVGGLPRRMKFELLEPLRQLFKDEVREVGVQLGLPRELIQRQPFPGPGLAVRILGEVTPPRLEILRNADWIVVEEMKKAGLYYQLWQAFAVLLPVRSVGVMGDERTYENCIAIRAVESQDGMTADWAKLPHELLEKLSNRIINEVRGVNRVVFDISSKPPATIEWE